ncbi:MAG: hypothetical protein K2O16_09245 [Lachnospiraceae bacterium]|nr:hypothetical protein [Lachnospiraceae bacterium]
MRVSRIPALLITAMMIPAISGCTTQGSPAPDAVHQIEDGGSAVYDDDPIANGMCVNAASCSLTSLPENGKYYLCGHNGFARKTVLREL